MAGTAPDADVVVVGAGLAGLAAARLLRARGRSAIVLEARSRVGGRLEGGALGDGTPVELGGQWLGPSQNRMYELVDELGLETFPTHDVGRTVLVLGGRRTLVGSGPGAVPRISPFVLADVARGMQRFAAVCRSVPLDAPWLTPGGDVLDGQTFESWVRSNLRTKRGRTWFRIAAEAVFAAEARDVSALHAAFYCRSGGSLARLLATGGGAQQDRVVGGSVRIAEAMATDLGDAVRTSTPVRRIEQDDREVRVVARDGSVHTAHRVVVTLPPTLAGRLEYDPPMPPWRDQLTQKAPAGSVVKFHLAYDRPFWRDDGLSGQAAGDVSPVKVAFDNSPPSGSPGVLVGFMEGGDARVQSRRSADRRRSAAVGAMVRYFGDRASRPTDWVERDWSAEEFTRGCYGAHFAPGTWTEFGPALREPVGRIHWAGAECAPVWNGYMEGAVRSGEDTARTLCSLLETAGPAPGAGGSDRRRDR